MITPEPLPLPGQATSGAGLRAWGLTMGLRARGFDAIAASCRTAFSEKYLSGECPLPSYVRMFQRDRAGELIREVDPEVVILQHWGMAHEIPDLSVPLAIDLAGPHLLERLYWGTSEFFRDAEAKLAALRRADFVVCSGEYQRHYFYAWLALAGFDLRKTDVPVIPFSVPPPNVFPSTTEREPHSFVFGGLLLAWQDPSRGFRILLEEMDRQQKGVLHIFTGAHPVLDASDSHLAPLVQELRAHPRVRFHGIVPFDELLREYTKYEVAFDLMMRNPERELAFTTRTIVYLACGLPVVYNDYSEISQLIKNHECGWCISPDDESTIREVCRRILANDYPLSAMSKKAKELAEQLSWDKTITPLAEFCAHPFFRQNKQQSTLRTEALDREVDELRRRCAELEAELRTLNSKWIVRLARKLKPLRWLLAGLTWLAMLPVSFYIRRCLESTSRPR